MGIAHFMVSHCTNNKYTRHALRFHTPTLAPYTPVSNYVSYWISLYQKGNKNRGALFAYRTRLRKDLLFGIVNMIYYAKQSLHYTKQ